MTALLGMEQTETVFVSKYHKHTHRTLWWRFTGGALNWYHPFSNGTDLVLNPLHDGTGVQLNPTQMVLVWYYIPFQNGTELVLHTHSHWYWFDPRAPSKWH